jgi:hypothetical protein
VATAPPPVVLFVTAPASSYSLAERWLHWLALEPVLVREMSFELERQFWLPRRRAESNPAGGAVYVCGLARSGTTLLLRLLDQLDEFSSLSYRDMPFPLAPNAWRRAASLAHRTAVAAPRLHGDGVQVDFDSPEGFEEVFWRTFTRYSIRDGVLSADTPSPEAVAAFADYRALVANPRTNTRGDRSRRYLSKNNNNLLRLRWLCQEPDATVLLVFRDPAAAARSMHATHLRFAARQAQDRFTRRYMDWLCHYEFGLDHKPFGFAAASMDKGLDPTQPDYWLGYWCAVHEQLLQINGPALRLLDYDVLCRTPAVLLGALFRAIKVQADCDSFASQVHAPRPARECTFDPSLLARSYTQHRALRARADNL